MSDKKDKGWSADRCKECGRLRSNIGLSLGLRGRQNWTCDMCKQKTKRKKVSESDDRGGAGHPRKKRKTPIKLVLDKFPGGGWATSKRRGSNYQEVEQEEPNFSPVSSTEEEEDEQEEPKFSPDSSTGQDSGWGTRKCRGSNCQELINAGEEEKEQEEPNFSPVSSTEQDSDSASSSSYSAAH